MNGGKTFFGKVEIIQLHSTNTSLSSVKILFEVEMRWNPISCACQKNAVLFNFERNIHRAAADMVFVANGTCSKKMASGKIENFGNFTGVNI